MTLNDPNPELFDSHARTYSEEIESSFGLLADSHDFFIRHKAETILRILDEAWPGRRRDLSLLDVGCGIGLVDSYLAGEVGTLRGVDVSQASLDEARARNPGVDYILGGNPGLPIGNASYDCAFVVCVLHHVPVAERQRFVGEVARVLKPGGMVIVIEHNPLNPATLWIVNRCDLDRDAVLLRAGETHRLLGGAGFSDVRTRHVLFTPLKSSAFRRLDDWLSWLPFGAQYVTTATAADGMTQGR